MRDIISAPIFMRLGRRMRGPQGIPIGTLRRIIISNVVCSTWDSVAGFAACSTAIFFHDP